MPVGELGFHEVRSRRHAGPANLFIVEPSAGPIRAARFHHPTATWVFDPEVHRSMFDDFDKGEERISSVDRRRAEEVARLLGAVLPSDAALHRLMVEGAAAWGPPWSDWDDGSRP